MDADVRSFLKSAQGDEPPPGYGTARWTEIEGTAARLIERSAAEAALEILEQEPPPRKKRWDFLLLVALLQQGLGERARSLDALEVVADKLLAAGDREGILALLPRFLTPEPTPAAVRFLHFLAGGSFPEEERIEWLRTAISIRPSDPELHQDLAVLLERSSDADVREGAREHRLRGMELSLDDGVVAGMPDALFRAIEEDLEAAPARVGRILLRYAAVAPWADAEPILDLALSTLESQASGRITWADISPIGPRLPGTAPARALFARLFRMVVAKEPDPEAVVQGSGAADVKLPFEQIAARVPKIMALPPGAYVTHQTWGIGRVKESDGEALVLDFPGRAGHKMSFAMASRSLDRLPNDGLRVLAMEEPGKARALAEGGDPELLVRALRDVGGTATQAQLKPRLEAALPGFDQAVFWRKVKEKWKADPRVDTSEAYRGQFRLVPEGSVEASSAALPRLAPKAPGQGLQLIRKFLREHPEDEARLKGTAGPLVARWTEDPRLDATMRAQALCYAIAWHALDPAAARAVLEELVAQGLSPDDLALGSSQEQLVGLAQGIRGEEEFLWRAVESRLPRLRELGRERLKVVMGPERFARAVEQLMYRASEHPAVSARLVEHFAAHPGSAGAPPPEALLLATIRLLEVELPEGVPERLFGMLGEGGLLHTAFRAVPPSVESAEALERTVLHWSGSERRLLPILEFLHAAGLGELAEEHERRRRARAQDLLEGRTTEDVDTQFTLMTRATYDRLQAELAKVARDLKTVIPAAIEKARALGDLRENAEYDAAKQRQANAATRVQELMGMIQRARLIENLEIDAGRVGVGTETTLLPIDGNGDPPITFWILGEGDSGVAPGVLSYRAPLARPLLGKGVGAEVELAMIDGPRRFRVESIRRRLPGDPHLV
ncbi:MAG TPA: GreA/GreB family elongation factor [Candidatus Limnocylindrales bacterium]|nr:GreA/GreB family elongation factor [Candidatus Limnocylindrales bacterium]